MFADDLMLFCKADAASLQHLMKALQAFNECAGLKAHMQKSQMVFRGCPVGLQQ